MKPFERDMALGEGYMRIISRVVIDGFRSIDHLDVPALHEYVPLVGLNGSGKSNVLRALNLLFNGHLDDALTTVNVTRDFPDFVASKRQKKVIGVGVELDLEPLRKVRPVGDFKSSVKAGGTLAVRKEWQLGPDRLTMQERLLHGPSLEKVAESSEGDRQAVQTYLRAVQFRYVPNHIRPAEFMREELQLVRPVLVARLRATKAYQTAGVDAAMAALKTVAGTMFKNMAQSVEAGATGRTVETDLPTDFAELAFQVGLNMITEGGRIQTPDLQGSGTQSFMLLHVLDLLDRVGRGSAFGWTQAHVWALEEPESFLHAGLRSRFATDLRKYATDQRRQVFLTTHQDEFVRVAERTWIATYANSRTTLDCQSSREALSIATRARVTNFAHPLLDQPDTAIVIVEGKQDAHYLRLAMASRGLRPRWRLATLDEVDPGVSGGSNVDSYLRHNLTVIRSRPDVAPVIVVLDWDVPDARVADAAKMLEGVHPYSTCVKAPVDLANPELGATFKGIERYLDTKHIEAVIPSKHLRPASAASNYPLGVDRVWYRDNKSRLVPDARSNPYLVDLLDWVDGTVKQQFGLMPMSLF